MCPASPPAGRKPRVTQVQSWERLSPTLSVRPQQALAALLGHAASRQALEAAGLVAPDWALFRQDPSLDRNPHGLDLPADLLELALFVRCMALWGPRAFERAAFACADLQRARQPDGDAALRLLRDAAFEAARAHLAQPGEASRAAAEQAAAACRDWWGERHDDDPDTEAARASWCELGAPWFAAEVAADPMAFTEWDGEPPRAASWTWGNRHAVWPERATEAAAAWSTPAEVQAAMRDALLAWALDDRVPPEDFT